MSLFFKLPKITLFYLPLRHLLKYHKRGVSLKVGDTATLTKKITFEEVKKFAEVSGDTNPIHIDKEYIKEQTKFEDCVVHGAFLNSVVSGIIGTRLPGPGTLVVKQELNFPSPCYVEEEINVTVKLTGLRKILTVDFSCVTNSGKVVLWGNCRLVLQPTRKS